MNNQDEYQAAPLTVKQKRVLRIVVSCYLFLMGAWTVYKGDYGVGSFYALLVSLDFYLYINISDWVRIKKK